MYFLNPQGPQSTAMYLVSSLHIGPYPSWASDTPWRSYSLPQFRIQIGQELREICMRRLSKLQTVSEGTGAARRHQRGN